MDKRRLRGDRRAVNATMTFRARRVSNASHAPSAAANKSIPRTTQKLKAPGKSNGPVGLKLAKIIVVPLHSSLFD